MKTLRQACAATVLSLTLAVSAFAGDIYSPGKASTGGTTPISTTIILTIVDLLIYR